MESNKDLPGLTGETFKIKINKESFVDPLVLKNMHRIEITSYPVEVYHQWYWRVLNILTFGFFFNRGWVYNAKVKSKDNNE